MVFFLFRHSTYSFGNIIENYCYCDSVLKVCKRINSNFFEKLFRFAAIPQSKLNATGETGEERNVDNNWKMVASCGCLRENSMSHFVSYTLFFFYMYHRSVVATHLRRRHFFSHCSSSLSRSSYTRNVKHTWALVLIWANCKLFRMNRESFCSKLTKTETHRRAHTTTTRKAYGKSTVNMKLRRRTHFPPHFISCFDFGFFSFSIADGCKRFGEFKRIEKSRNDFGNHMSRVKCVKIEENRFLLPAMQSIQSKLD